jgi:ABC-2 type transport system permease protein
VAKEMNLMHELSGMYAVFLRELIRYIRSKERIVGSLTFPLFFLLVFGVGLGSSVSLKGFNIDYLDFLAPGIIAMVLLFTSIFSGVSVIWDRELGFMKEMLIAPVSRFSIVMGKCIGTATSTMVQATLMFVIVILMGANIDVGMFPFALPVMFLASIMFVSIGVAVGSLLRNVEGFQVIMNFIIQPMFFLSGALFPINQLPTWLQVITYLDPMTYAVEIIRYIFTGVSTLPILMSFGALIFFVMFFFTFATWAFSRVE